MSGNYWGANHPYGGSVKKPLKNTYLEVDYFF
jgi:hypothetical protein